MPGRWSIAILAIACLALSAGCRSARTDGSGPDERAAVARQFVRLTAAGKFADAIGPFDAVMRQAMSADQLRQAWQELTKQEGAFKRIVGARTGNEAGFDMAIVACRFEKTLLDVKIFFDKDGKIGGLWFVPHIPASEARYSPPPYEHKDRFDERQVTVGSGEWKLPGTLSVPRGKGPFPAVVLVHGSGANDRDEAVGANKPFRDLAHGLASRGVAVLRYDKRTKVYGPKMALLASKMTVKDEVIDDALAAFRLLRGSRSIDPKRVFVLGHSLGATLIPRIGKADRRITGLIMMAGASGTRPFEDLVLEQLVRVASLNGPPSAEARKQIEEVRRQAAVVKRMKSPDYSGPEQLALGASPAYWRDFDSYRPVEAARSLRQPMLVLQGGRDYQVTKDNYEHWSKALRGRRNVTLKLYPELNHLFAPGKGRSTPQEYARHTPVSRAVIDDLAEWIGKH